MKNNKFINELDRMFENPDKIQMSQLETLLTETLKFFESVRERMQSDDPKVKEQAMQEATEMQEKLNLVTESIYKKTGLTKEKAEQILSNPSNFKPEDWMKMQSMESDLTHFKDRL
jgi:hypothetical protein